MLKAKAREQVDSIGGMHVAGVAREKQPHVCQIPACCCVREVNTGTGTGGKKEKKNHPPHKGVAIYLTDVPTFPQPSPGFLVTYCTVPLSVCNIPYRRYVSCIDLFVTAG